MNEFRLRFGSDINCGDTRCGALARIAFSPETWQITHLIVEDGLLFKEARVLPFSTLVPVADHEENGVIHVDAVAGRLEEYPHFREEVVEVPGPEHRQAAYGGNASGWNEVGAYGIAPVPPTPVLTERVFHGVPEGSVVLGDSATIEALSGEIGKLDGFLVSAADGAITAVLVRQGLLFTSNKALAASRITSLAEDSILVDDAAKQPE